MITSTIAAAVLAAGLFGAVSASANRSEAASSPQTQASAAARAQAKQERQICVVTDMPSTRMQRRICKTAREWEHAGGLPE